MASLKAKGDLGLQRRPSLGSADVSLKDMMLELQKISQKQDLFQKELSDMNTKQNLQQQLFQEQFEEIKKEIKEEVGQIKREVVQLKEDYRKLEKGELKREEAQKKIQEKIKSLDSKNEKLARNQERLELKELEYQLRLRNIQEDPKENIQQLITELLATWLNLPLIKMEQEIDQIYRISTFYSRKNKTPRDIIVHLIRKKTRDEILWVNSKNPLHYEDTKVAILKEFPQSILMKRRQYFFLTEELKKRKIRFRWERNEGIMTTHNDQKFWLTSIEKAKEFYKLLTGETGTPLGEPVIKKKTPPTPRQGGKKGQIYLTRAGGYRNRPRPRQIRHGRPRKGIRKGWTGPLL
nr:PREDICTED: trichohyalin-like [Anolis carolinensis]|eukprot:XP_008101251.2 PREDICTED: trichohyalin-like [Anolis carolinensis]